MRYRALLFTSLIVGVVSTISRSAILLTLLFVLFAMRTGLLDRVQSTLLAVAVPVLAAAVSAAYLLVLFALPEINQGDVLGRVLWFASAGREVDDSAASRFQAAAIAFEMFFQSPLLGHGYASTMRVAANLTPHNMYLMLAAEQGVVGLTLYLTFLGLIGTRARETMRGARLGERRREVGLALLAMFAFVAIQSLFSHNMLEHPSLFVAMPFLLAASSRSGES
jgi:O-antigen ligase